VEDYGNSVNDAVAALVRRVLIKAFASTRLLRLVAAIPVDIVGRHAHAAVKLGLNAKKFATGNRRERTSRAALAQIVYFHEPNARFTAFAANDRSVITGSER
jgi:hypothetical protein